MPKEVDWNPGPELNMPDEIITPRGKGKAKAAPEAEEVEWTPPTEDQQIETEELSDDDSPLLTALGQGALMGFSDELMAKLESAIAGTDYRQNWERRQQELDRYRRLAPKTMIGGEIAGALPMMLLPGAALGNVARLGRLGTLGRGFALAAGQGAIEGVGKGYRPYTGENPNTGEPLTPAQTAAIFGLDAFWGGAEGAAGHGTTKAIKETASFLARPVTKFAAPYAKAAKDWTLETMAKPVFKVPREVAKTVLEIPEAFRGKAKTIEEIAKKQLVPMVNKISQEVSDGKAAAIKLLKPNVAVGSATQVINVIKKKLKEHDIIFPDPTKPGKVASMFGGGVLTDLKAQEKYLKSLEGSKGFISEKDLRKYYDSIKRHAKYNSNNPGEVADAYYTARGALNEVLDRNKAYKNAMTPVRDITPDLEKMRRALKLEPSKIQGARYATQDKTFNVLRQMAKKEDSAETIQNFLKKHAPDSDAYNQVRRANVEKHFGLKAPSAGTYSSGPAGAALAAAGLPLPGALVGAAGLTRDVFGPNIFKGLATAGSKGGPGFLDAILRPISVTGSVTPSARPEFIGYPFHNISAEEHLRRLQEQRERQAEIDRQAETE